ncbi:MAG: hypothetical protein J6T84_07315 [Spirochaetaceae bacterium]|nr:hypothetical protein [Spirochaetaceae bacterium]
MRKQIQRFYYFSSNFFFILILLPLLVFCGCGGGGGISSLQDFYKPTVEYVLTFPDIPPEILQLVTNSELVWMDENYTIRSKTLPINAKGETILLASGKTAPVLLFPMIQGNRFFIPAGAIHPFGTTEDSRIYLSWENGFAADVFHKIITAESAQTLAEKESYCSYFNWDHLLDVINKNRPAYLLDETKIIQAICSGTIKASSVKKVKTFTVDTSLIPVEITQIYSPDIMEGNLMTKSSFEIPQTGSIFYSNLGFIKIEKHPTLSNSLVITELAR